MNVRPLVNIFKLAAFIALTCACLLAQDSKRRSVAQDQPYTDDQVVRYAKSIDVAKLDSTLLSQPLEEWLLHGPARIDELHWRVSRDCDLKDPIPDADGDLPLCVKVPFRRANAVGIGMLRVGTLKHGISGQPAFQYLFAVYEPFSIGGYDKLSDFPRYLDGIPPEIAQDTRKTGVAVELDGQNPLHLRVSLRSHASTTATFYRSDLPWGNRYSMVFAAVRPNGEPVDLSFPIDDPGPTKVSVKPGETLTGDIDLQYVIRDLSAMKKSDILLFWAYKCPIELNLPRWSGGWVLIPKKKN